MIRLATIAAGILLCVSGCRRAELTTAPKRALAARLSYAGLDRWRPFAESPGDPKNAREVVSLETLARLSAAGDLHGVGDLSLLSGDRGRAAQALARAPHDANVDADRAVVTLERGDVGAALEQLDAVLKAQPRHPQALWNRALALVALELPLAAAQAFDGVAALDEPGWSQEARQRSAALTAGWKDRVTRTTADIAAAKAMITGGPLPGDDVVRRAPSMVRHYFYHAARSAPSPARLRELRPLAHELDGIFGEPMLAPFIDRIATEAPQARAELGPRYARYMMMPMSPPAVPPAEQAQFFAAIAKAHADDLMLGSLVLFNRTSPAELAQLAQLVARNGDPWWRARLAQTEASLAGARGDLDGAAQQLGDAIAACNQHHLDFRCVDLEKQLAFIELDRHQTSVAHSWALATIGSAHAAGMVPLFQETGVVFLLGDVARYRNDFSLMRAYLAEGLLRVPNNCFAQRQSHLTLGVMDVFQLAMDDAARELAAAPVCDHAASLLLAGDLVTSLYLAGRATPQAKTLPAELHAGRATLTPSQRIIADVLEARLLLAGDRDAALALLRPAMAPARAGLDADGKKARTFAYQLLAVDAGRRGDFGDALDRLAAEAGVPAGQRCALGVALDDARVVVAARDGAGQAVGHYEATRPRPEIDAAHLVPEAVRAALSACPEVSVYALAPLHGQPEILPPELAWSYRMGRGPSQKAAVSPSPPSPSSGQRLVISDVLPPATLSLPRLFPWTTSAPGVRWLAGASATPAHVLAELGDAGEIEFNAHGLVDLDLSDTWLLALSPDAAGHFALTAADLERQPLRHRPLVVLAACNAGRVAPYLHEPWSLPLAFIDAGARAVFASAEAIPDASAGPFFDAVLARVRGGQSPSVALRDERQLWLRQAVGSWTRYVLAFE
jgi:hypothetical protein